MGFYGLLKIRIEAIFYLLYLFLRSISGKKIIYSTYGILGGAYLKKIELIVTKLRGLSFSLRLMIKDRLSGRAIVLFDTSLM